MSRFDAEPFEAEPLTFGELLEIVFRDGDEINLKQGEYKGPYIIDKSITLIGTGRDTEFFAENEPALVVTVPGVKIENLAINRTVGGDTGEVAILAQPGTKPILSNVKLTGAAENVRWQNIAWNMPTVFDFGEIETNWTLPKTFVIELGSACQVICEHDWLKVKPSYLSPGTQEIQLELNSRDIPPGTALSGRITLQTLETAKCIKEIGVTAKTKGSLLQSNETLLQIENQQRLDEIASEDWGYRFFRTTAENLIRNIEGNTAIETYPDLENRATDLLFDLVGRKHYLFYIWRRRGERTGEEKWDLILATDRDDIELPAMLVERNQTLRLRAALREDGSGGLQLLDVRLLPKHQGQIDGFSVPFRLRLLSNYQRPSRIPISAIKRMQNQPFVHGPTEEQIAAWQKFLALQERIAKSRQFCVQFVSHNYGQATRNITFVIDVNSATVDGTVNNPLDIDEFWERARRAHNERLEIRETFVAQKQSRNLGTIDRIDPERRTFRINLDSEISDLLTEGNHILPNTGFISFVAVGDIIQINRQTQALQRLANGQCQNPFLREFLFNAAQARIPENNIKLNSEDLLLKTANQSQIAAVETVLSVPDFALIQGPPGTGKTTVIAEICYQVARRGGRTLISSQANLAVDNALSRLEHNPIIRAVRKGNENSVGQEGAPFLESQVIGTWLQNTSADCENRLNNRIYNVEIFSQLLSSSQRFTTYRQLESEFVFIQRNLQERQNGFKLYLDKKKHIYQEAKDKECQLKSWDNGLNQLLQSRHSINWNQAEVKSLLKDIQHYLDQEILVKTLKLNVPLAIQKATQLEMIPPQQNLFGLAGWLHNSVPPWIEEVKNIFVAANFALSLVLLELEQWSLQDYSHLRTVLENSLETRQPLNADSIPLPTKLLALAPITSPIIWEKIIPDCQGEIDRLVAQYRQWDRFCDIESKIRNLIDPVLNRQNIQIPSEEIIAQQQLGIERLNSVAAVEQLYQLSVTNISVVKKQLNLWNKITEFLRATGVKMNLCKPSDRVIAIATLEKIRKFIPKLSSDSKPQEIQVVINFTTDKIISNAVNNSRTWLTELQDETNLWIERLGEKIIPNNPNINAYNSIQKLLQKIIHLPQVPDELKSIAQQYIRNPVENSSSQSSILSQLRSWGRISAELNTLIHSINPFDVLSNVRNQINLHIEKYTSLKETARIKIEDVTTKLNIVNAELQQNLEHLQQERNWWQQAWEAIPVRLRSEMPSTGLFEADFLLTIESQFDAWRQELKQEQAYLSRYQNLVQDWITRLRSPSDQDRNELKRIYLDNANVVGITCVQAARGDFSQEFKSFDVVIIDEVSKCTPPELLIPALKAKKLVLVGDHRQLPPMLDSGTLEEIAEELNTTREEINFLEQSLFKLRFEEAENSIKRMLTIQYRMHPSIMGAINQFYDGRLECGLFAPDQERSHNLSGEIIQENHHIIWKRTPQQTDYEERREGTSIINPREVDEIEQICRQMEQAWSSQIVLGNPRKEIGIITFYGAQLRLIEERIANQNFPSLHIRTGTVDRFQGMERPVIIVSLVRNNRKGEVGFAKKPERVNVAFSRAKELLVIVGCHSLFTQQQGKVGRMYSNISEIIRLHGGLI